ncbi:MAG: cysteine desulfurase [Armatimonadetes bacterium]|nr:cysteine desulfurase [Armatimonadota bacterium]
MVSSRILELKTQANSESCFDVEKIRADFPILHRLVHGKPLVYLDNAATTQKPQSVINAITDYYTGENANIHRGVHYLSEQATRDYESARETVRQFLNARESREIIFVRGATEGINLVAHTFGRQRVRAGDEIVISAIEHHSNIVPWQMLCEQTGAQLKIVPVDDQGKLRIEVYERFLGPRTKLVSIVHISNVLGTIVPVRRMIEMAHHRRIPVLVDGAQSAAHLPIDVQALDCDFFVLSGHKIFGPTGIGVLYGKAEWLEEMPPYQGGGDMISSVTFEKTLYNVIPYKFEAGTPHIAGVIGLGAAIEYLNEIGLNVVSQYESELMAYATRKLESIPRLTIIGNTEEKASVISFVLADIHPHDIGTIMDREGIAIRTGHHCAQPVMNRYGVPATARASFALYNTKAEVDALAAGIIKVQEVFKG